MMKRISKSAKVVLLFAVLFAGIWGARKLLVKPTQTTVAQTATVEKGTVVSSIEATGRVTAGYMTDVSTEATGVVEKVLVKEGDKVKKGQQIASIDLDAAAQEKYASAWSAYLSAKNALESAKASEWSLQSAMFSANQKLINDAVARDLDATDPTYIQQNADWLAAEAKYKNQQAVIAQSSASLTAAAMAYQSSAAIITAPADGTIINIGIAEGMILGEQSDAVAPTRVAVVKKDNGAFVTATVNELDVTKIEVGQKSVITLDSLADKTFTGKVVAVDKLGTVSNNVTSYNAVIAIDSISAEVLPNMAATAQIILQVKSDVLLVPSGAITTRNGQSFVTIRENKEEKEVEVETGLSSDSGVEIVSGVSEGDMVVISASGRTNASGAGPSQGTSVFGSGGFGGGAVFRVAR